MQNIFKSVLVTIFVLSQFGLKAQKIDQITAGFGTQGFEISLQKTLISNTSAVFSVGLAMEGLTNQLNDPLLSLGLNYRLFHRKANSLELTLQGGFMQINDPLVKMPIAIFRSNVSYKHFFGEKARHGFNIAIGYVYGQRKYRQTNEDMYFRTELVSTFKVSPIYAHLAYIYRF